MICDNMLSLTSYHQHSWHLANNIRHNDYDVQLLSLTSGELSTNCLSICKYSNKKHLFIAIYSSPSILQSSILRPPLNYKTGWFGPKGQFSVSNDLYFKTTCNIRTHFLGPMRGLKIDGLWYVLIEAPCPSGRVGVTSKYFNYKICCNVNNKACWQESYIHIPVYTVTGTMWNFVYEEVVIVHVPAAKQTGIWLTFYCFLMIFWCLIRHLVWICPLTDTVCLLLEGLEHLIGNAPLYEHIH